MTTKPRIGLALAGGAPLGAGYEIGALAAIEEAIEGLNVNDADIYVGISAGGIIAASLANGINPVVPYNAKIMYGPGKLASAI